jgi:hypothetical protein
MMERTQVVSILRSLAEGVDPTKNEPAHQVFAQPDVIRALFIAAEVVSEAESGARIERTGTVRSDRPLSAGLPWSDDEDARLGAEYDAHVVRSEIAALHGRTRGAITSRLVKLGKLDANSVRPRERFLPLEKPVHQT